jgi:hypothetical protein
MRIKTAFRFALYGAFGVLFVTGVVWLIADRMKDGPSSDHCQQVAANALMVHGGATMVTLMLLGALVPSHIQRAWRAKKNRLTGVISLTVYGLLIVTAFGLYYFGSDMLRPWLSFFHAAIGLAVPAVIATHVLVGRGIFDVATAPAPAPLRRVARASVVTLVPDERAGAAALSEINGL